MLYGTMCFGSTDWIPYVQNYYTYPIIEVPTVPSVTYTNITIPQNIVRYQWVPIYNQRPTFINQYGLFVKRQQVIYQPTIEWVLQPIYYR